MAKIRLLLSQHFGYGFKTIFTHICYLHLFAFSSMSFEAFLASSGFFFCLLFLQQCGLVVEAPNSGSQAKAAASEAGKA